MTLNAVMAFILRFSPNLTDFQGDYITVVKDHSLHGSAEQNCCKGRSK